MYQNFRPITSSAQAREIGRKGGLVSSPRKRYAARLRELKKRGMTNEAIAWLTDVMEDPDCSALDILIYLHNIRANCKTEYEKIAVVGVLIKWHKMHHGTKIRTENIYQPVDWNAILDGCVMADREHANKQGKLQPGL